MKKISLLLLFVIAFLQPGLAQQIDIDSIVKVVAARNPGKTNSLISLK